MIELPLFENRRPDDSTISVTGGVDFTPPGAPAHRLDETIYLVVQARVSKVAHSTDKDGALSRVHTATVEDLAVLDAEAGGGLLREARRTMLEGAGVHELPMEDPTKQVADAAIDAVNAGALGPNVTASRGEAPSEAEDR